MKFMRIDSSPICFARKFACCSRSARLPWRCSCLRSWPLCATPSTAARTSPAPTAWWSSTAPRSSIRCRSLIATRSCAFPASRRSPTTTGLAGVYQDEKNFFPQFVIDPENQRQVFPNSMVPDDQWNAFVKDRQGAIAGAQLAERFHWKIGDRIPIKDHSLWRRLVGIQSRSASITARARRTMKPSSGSSGIISRKRCRRVQRAVGWYVAEVDNPDDSPRVAKAIDAEFANSPFETKTTAESAFAAGLGEAVRQHSIPDHDHWRESSSSRCCWSREHDGHLRARTHRGTRRLQSYRLLRPVVLFFVLAESLVIALIGGALGLLLAVLAVPGLATALNGMLPGLFSLPICLGLDCSWPFSWDFSAGFCRVWARCECA